ncbi:DUF4157 domain-containing protein [Lentzea sp. NPDC005914]|uniref:eCIS core domain-containing protein n=1 Tax=Lentzea sp. NPDC005914 TaxID=3154572 RepID=UPI0033D636BB
MSRVTSAPLSARTAEERWRAAVAAVPLESPRPFPTALRPLVRRYAGDTERPSYTTGPRTRRALAEAGALGATTGTVVHLPELPSTQPSVVGVLAHELTHTRQPVTRPRFLLRRATGAVDSDERAALSANRTVRRWPDLTSGPAGALSTAAGVVDQLPVGGAGAAVAEAAATAARAAVVETFASATGGRSALAAAGGAVDQTLSQVAELPGVPGSDARSLSGQAQATVSTVAGRTADQVPVTAAGQQAAGQQSVQAGRIDIDRLTRELEQRLLRQLERRGGRYTGVF